ncbi:hypothetical protein H4I96_09552 [Botrytis cinerea]
MSKRTVFTTVTPLPTGITRETVMETLRSHVEMIDLNPLVEERHPIKPPPNATAEEYHCLCLVYLLLSRSRKWIANTLLCAYGLNIRGKWTLGGSLPGEPVAPVELGANVPLHGLWLREDVDMRCNIVMTSFVKKTLKKSHSALVNRLLVKAQLLDRSISNARLNERTFSTPELATKRPRPFSSQTPLSQPSTAYSQSSDYDDDSAYAESEASSPQYAEFAAQNTPAPQTSKVCSPINLQNSQLQTSQVHPALRVGPPQPQAKPEFNENSIYPKYDPSAYPRAPTSAAKVHHLGTILSRAKEIRQVACLTRVLLTTCTTITGQEWHHGKLLPEATCGIRLGH